MSYYQRHVFFCTNLRTNGKKCCGQVRCESEDFSFRDYAKKRLKQLGLHGKGQIRTSTSGCMGRCEEGPVVVIYPDNIWYRYENLADIDEIIEQHLINNTPVARLLLED